MRVIKVVAVHEAGRVINRTTFESQVHGGVMMGLGYALLERRTMDKPEGRVINPNLEDYKMIGPEELPEIETVIVEPITPANNVGGKGIGEPCTVPTAAAVANAVATPWEFAFTNYRLRRTASWTRSPQRRRPEMKQFLLYNPSSLEEAVDFWARTRRGANFWPGAWTCWGA